ncbi:MAG TPA: FAD-dependent oxidoreductase [Gaiellales bacterium]|nr:FAD-dependent oxidoreductase [Gaiellales bacterium]
MADQLESRYRARSMWLDQVPGPLTPRPGLPGDVDCDVAVVGAGFTGLWTAYYLKRLQPDLRIVVLEREIAGYGPSGRNGGWVSAGIAGTAAVYRHRGGAEAVRRATRATIEGVDEIGRAAAEEGIDCDYLKAGWLAVAGSEAQRQRLQETIENAHANGFGDDYRVLDGDELRELVDVRGSLMAAHNPNGARVDPARLARGLAARCEAMGVTIHERTAALELAPGRVRCAAGTVRAGTVLRATESYTTQLPGERLRYLPLYSLMIATEPLPEAVWDGLGWRDGLLIMDYRHLFFYAQRTADGRIALGGRGAPYRLRKPISEENERNADVRHRLEATIARHFPAAAEAAITHHWGGPLAVPRDWCMSISFDRATGVGWAGGYSGHGVVSANIAGRTMADLVLNRQSDLVSLPWVGHRNRRWEPEPARFLASRAIVRILADADEYEQRTGHKAARVRLVAPFMAEQ